MSYTLEQAITKQTLHFKQKKKKPMKSPDMETKNVPFTEFDLRQEVLKGIGTAGFSHCTSVQAMALPITLKGGDVAAQAQTGTGKTAAFLITIFDNQAP
jgi:ATP-dependent RNA helicase RhlB